MLARLLPYLLAITHSLFLTSLSSLSSAVTSVSCCSAICHPVASALLSQSATPALSCASRCLHHFPPPLPPSHPIPPPNPSPQPSSLSSCNSHSQQPSSPLSSSLHSHVVDHLSSWLVSRVGLGGVRRRVCYHLSDRHLRHDRFEQLLRGCRVGRHIRCLRTVVLVLPQRTPRTTATLPTTHRRQNLRNISAPDSPLPHTHPPPALLLHAHVHHRHDGHWTAAGGAGWHVLSAVDYTACTADGLVDVDGVYQLYDVGEV